MHISLGARHDFLRRYGEPEGWAACNLGAIADVVGGGTPSRDESRFWANGTIPWATPTDLTANLSKFLATTAESISEAGLASSAATLLPAGTVLFTSRATIGAKAIASAPITTNQGFASFIPRKVDGEYLYYLLDLLLPSIKRLGAGTTFDEVSKRDIRKVWCAIPVTKEEQAAIAGVLDAIDKAIGRTRCARDAAAETKRALRQQLFGHGTRGKTQRKTAIGWVPTSWTVIELRSVIDEFQYGMSLPMQLTGNLPILRMGNIQSGDVLLSDLKYVTLPERFTTAYLLQRGDVLFNRTNSQDLVGKIGIYRSDEPSVFASYLIRLKNNPEQVDSYYLGQLLDSYDAQCRIKRYATPGVEQVNINAKNLGKVLIPLPPDRDGLEEQKEIATILEQADETIRSFRPKLEALQELKRALTHDLLTGTVRVKDIHPKSGVAA